MRTEDGVDTVKAIERQTEAGKQGLEQTLGRPFTDAKRMDELARRKVTS